MKYVAKILVGMLATSLFTQSSTQYICATTTDGFAACIDTQDGAPLSCDPDIPAVDCVDRFWSFSSN